MLIRGAPSRPDRFRGRWAAGSRATDARVVSLLVALMLLAGAQPASAVRPTDFPPKPDVKREREAQERRLARDGFVELTRISFSGNALLSDSELRAVMFSRAPDLSVWKAPPDFSESTLQGDMTRLEALYREHGFYQSEASYTLVYLDEGTRVRAKIEIDEGPAVMVQTLDVAFGGPLEPGIPPPEDLMADYPLEVGERFSAIRYGEAKDILLERLANAGHPIARIEGGADVDVPTSLARVRWKVDVGPLVELGPITIEGLYLVKEKTVWREVKLKEGQRYSTRRLGSVRRGLLLQGLYDWVSIEPDRGSAPATGAPEAAGEVDTVQPARVIWPLVIRVTERDPQSVDLGVGYGSDEKFRATVGWRHSNFFGDARKLRISALYSAIRLSADIDFANPYTFDPKLDFRSHLSLRREIEPVYDADRLIINLGVSRPVGGRWRARLNYEFSYNDVTQTSFAAGVILTEPEGISRLGSFEVGARRVALDDLLNPTSGTWFDFFVEPALREFGSNFDFINLAAEVRGFLPLGPTVIAARLRLGTVQPVRSTTPSNLPVVARLQSGGSNSHRGFQYHRMPPTGSLDLELGGTSLLESSIEWRVPLMGKLSGVAFVDAGEIDLDPFRWQLDELFWAVGPGVRYDTIVGPIRFDFGTLLNPPPGAARFQWFISVGHAF